MKCGKCLIVGYRHLPVIHMPTNIGYLGYLAGLLDGEGNITVNRAFDKRNSKSISHHPGLVISNTNPAVINWLLEMVGGSADLHIPSTEQPNWKDSYRWRIHGMNVTRFLEPTLEFLIVKHRQAEIALEINATKGLRSKKLGLPLEVVERRERLTLELNQLNKKGRSTPIPLIRDRKTFYEPFTPASS